MSNKHDISKERAGAFIKQLAEAELGDEIIYHIGKYAAGPHKHDAYNKAIGGLCVVYQRRLGRGVFAYTAKKVK